MWGKLQEMLGDNYLKLMEEHYLIGDQTDWLYSLGFTDEDIEEALDGGIDV